MESKISRTVQSKNLQIAGYEFFRNIKRNEEFCDVAFHIGGKTISAHRIVIAAAIPYYRQLLRKKSEASEESDDENEFSMPEGIDPNAFESLIEFAYSGEIVISNENVKCLLSVAWHLHVKEVIEVCCDFLINSLNAENVFDIRNFAGDLKCAALLKDIDEYICENYTEIWQQEGFCDLPLQCVEELLKRDDLRVPSEENVFASVMKWVNEYPEERKAILAELLKKVRMNLLNPLYLKNHVAAERLIHESIPCRDLLDEARDCHLFPDHQATLSFFSAEPRCKMFATSSSTDDSMYVLSGSILYTAQYLNQQQQIWETEPDKIFHHVISSSAVVGAKIYYFHQNKVIGFDPQKNAYSSCQSLQSYKCDYGTTSLKGKIYLCGGRNALSYFKSVECYNPEKDSWENVSDMQESRSSPGVTTLAACVYVLGGTNGISVHKSVEKYDLRSGKWRAVPSMLTARRSFGCTTLNGRIYTCGGISTGGLRVLTAEMYNPMENKWMFISSINTVRYMHQLVACHGKLYAVGGKDANNRRIYAVEIYDPNSSKWKFGEEINNRSYIAAVEVIASAHIANTTKDNM